MTDITANSSARDLKTISMVSTVHGMSHFYQLTLPPLLPVLKVVRRLLHRSRPVDVGVLYLLRPGADPGRVPGGSARRAQRPDGRAGGVRHWHRADRHGAAILDAAAVRRPRRYRQFGLPSRRLLGAD